MRPKGPIKEIMERSWHFGVTLKNLPNPNRLLTSRLLVRLKTQHNHTTKQSYCLPHTHGKLGYYIISLTHSLMTKYLMSICLLRLPLLLFLSINNIIELSQYNFNDLKIESTKLGYKTLQPYTV